MRCMASSSSVTSLKYLDIRATNITDNGMIDYLQSPNSENLQYLDISHLGDGITSATIDALCSSEYCRNLVVLNCRNSLIGNDALQRLSASINASHLEDLDLAIIDDNKKKLSNSSKFNIPKRKETKVDHTGYGKQSDT